MNGGSAVPPSPPRRRDASLSNLSASLVAALCRNRPFAHPTSTTVGRSGSENTADQSGGGVGARCFSASGFVIFFIRRWMFVLSEETWRRGRRWWRSSSAAARTPGASTRSSAEAPPSPSPDSAARDDDSGDNTRGRLLLSSAAALLGLSPRPGAWREQKPSHPSAARDAQKRRRRATYFAHWSGRRASDASANSAALTRWYSASHSASAAISARLLFTPRSRSHASSRRLSSSRHASRSGWRWERRRGTPGDADASDAAGGGIARGGGRGARGGRRATPRPPRRRSGAGGCSATRPRVPKAPPRHGVATLRITRAKHAKIDDCLTIYHCRSPQRTDDVATTTTSLARSWRVVRCRHRPRPDFAARGGAREAPGMRRLGRWTRAAWGAARPPRASRRVPQRPAAAARGFRDDVSAPVARRMPTPPAVPRPGLGSIRGFAADASPGSDSSPGCSDSPPGRSDSSPGCSDSSPGSARSASGASAPGSLAKRRKRLVERMHRAKTRATLATLAAFVRAHARELDAIAVAAAVRLATKIAARDRARGERASSAFPDVLAWMLPAPPPSPLAPRTVSRRRRRRGVGPRPRVPLLHAPVARAPPRLRVEPAPERRRSRRAALRRRSDGEWK